MATKNIVPRANGEGGIGTSAKRWLNGFFKNMTVDTSMNVPTAGDSENSTKAASTAWVENVFFAKLVTKLAANTAASISSLNTSSLFYRMLSWALTASGVQYNFTNSSAWYICFGSLLGGLIIQGGYMNNGDGFGNTKTFPITFSSPMTNAKPTIICMGRSVAALTDATIKTPYIDKFEWNAWTNGAAATSVNSIGVYWIAVGF